MKKMKTLFKLLTLLVLTYSAAAQTTHNFETGASYSHGQYYQLSTDTKTNLSHTAWDIAFSVYAGTEAAIFINEGSASSSIAPKLYLVPGKNFSDNITVSDLGDQLRNDEKSWSDGAFNSIKVASNWADYGWGVYNMSSHRVEGIALYAIQLSNGTYQKLMIDTLKNATYHFRYADFDGSNLQQKNIQKSAFPNQTLAYFSFSTGATVNAEPTTGWDWLFTRYETTLDNAGTLIPYMVAGILTNRNVEAVMADGIDPSTVDAANYTTNSDSLTNLGHTWKTYDFTNGWLVDADRVYFIKTADSSLYKIQFVDFQGSANGQGTFIKTSLGKWTAIEKTEKYNALESFNAFPNPVSTSLSIVFSLEQPQEELSMQLVDMLGRMLFEQKVQSTNSGLNALEIDMSAFQSGSYILTLQSKDVFISKSISVK